MKDILNQMTQTMAITIACIILIVLAVMLFQYLKKKAQSIEDTTLRAKVISALNLFENAVIAAVATTNQTYVDEIKKAGRGLTEEEAKAAFEKTKKSVLAMVSADTNNILKSTYDDISTLYKTTIEKAVADAKS